MKWTHRAVLSYREIVHTIRRRCRCVHCHTTPLIRSQNHRFDWRLQWVMHARQYGQRAAARTFRCSRRAVAKWLRSVSSSHPAVQACWSAPVWFQRDQAHPAATWVDPSPAPAATSATAICAP